MVLISESSLLFPGFFIASYYGLMDVFSENNNYTLTVFHMVSVSLSCLGYFFVFAVCLFVLISIFISKGVPQLV